MGFARFLLWVVLSIFLPILISSVGLAVSLLIAAAVSLVVGVIYYWPLFVPLLLVIPLLWLAIRPRRAGRLGP